MALEFEQLLDAAVEIVRRTERVTYAGLRRMLDIDEQTFADLRDELVVARRAVVDDGLVLMMASPSGDPDGERRRITVMFFDLVDSSGASSNLDPEDLRDMIGAYQSAVSSVVVPLGGFIAQYLGDGILVYFGYPRAYEDAARRASRAALEVLDRITLLSPENEKRFGIRLAVRIGVHTGEVVMAEIGGETRLALGQAPNIAARLQSIAKANQAIISFATWRLIEGFFSVERLGLFELKGIPQQVEALRLLAPTDAQSRFDAIASGSFSRFVGRARELARLKAAWARVTEGAPQRVLILAEAGMGKSRLLKVFMDSVREGDVQPLKGRCSPYHENAAFYTIIDLLNQAFGLSEDDAVEQRQARLHRELNKMRFDAPEDVSLLSTFLGIPLGAGQELQAFSPQQLKQAMMDAVCRLVGRAAEAKPVLLCVEDVHWIDHSSAELLRQLQLQRVLVVCTMRPSARFSFEPGEVSTGPEVQTIGLDPLERSESMLLLRSLIGNSAPEQLFARLLARTEGVPLFIEEQARALRRAGGGGTPTGQFDLSSALPVAETLSDSLMARLDGLDPEARELARIASVLGRRFSHELLRHVCHIPEPRMQTLLDGLHRGGVLLNTRSVGRARYYVFRHALLRDVAHDSLLKSARKRHHRHCAQALIEHVGEVERMQPELIAQHFAEAGEDDKAIFYYERAVAVASQKWALEEAAQHLRKALGLLDAQPPGAERTRVELRLLLALGPALMSLSGYASESVRVTYNRVREICVAEGPSEQLFSAVAGLWQFQMVGGNLPQAMELAQELAQVADRAGDSKLRLVALRAAGTTHFLIGDLSAALENLRAGWQLYDRREHAGLAATLGNDQGVAHGMYLAWALCLRGEPDAAREQAQASMALARELEHPMSIAFSHCYAGIIYRMCGELETAALLAKQARDVAHEHGLTLWVAFSRIALGWAHVGGDDPAVGLTELQEGIVAWQKTGARAGMTFFPVVLAEAQLEAGDLEAATASADEAEAMIERNGEHFYEAELLRVRGEIHARTGDTERARSMLEAARAYARQRQYHGFELRAVLALARLPGDRLSRRLLLEQLEACVACFQGGQDTTDFQAAVRLQAELIASAPGAKATPHASTTWSHRRWS